VSDLKVSGTSVDVLQPGSYSGDVVELELTDNSGYEYLQFEIDVQGQEQNVSFGVPFSAEITNKSLLGMLVEEVTGDMVTPNQDYDLEDIFMGVTFDVEIVHDSDGFPEVVKTKNDRLNIRAE